MRLIYTKTLTSKVAIAIITTIVVRKPKLKKPTKKRACSSTTIAITIVLEVLRKLLQPTLPLLKKSTKEPTTTILPEVI